MDGTFHVKENGQVYLNGVEIPRCFGFSIIAEGGKDPEVVLRVGVHHISIDGYTDYWSKGKEPQT